MESLYLIFGLAAAMIGAIPLGTVNIAVINTTLKEGIHKTPKLITAAGIAEVLLAISALYFSMALSAFFQKNIWIHYVLAIIFILAAIFFLTRKRKLTLVSDLEENSKNLKTITGFSLGILNPPVIIYWILAIGFLNEQSSLSLNSHLSYIPLFLFAIGVFIGKTTTLFLFAKASNRLQQKMETLKESMPKIMGYALLIIAVLQIIKLLLPF